ncbi:RNA-binding motif single-stranded-interacting protein 3, partial [Clonorchis sinensis]
QYPSVPTMSNFTQQQWAALAAMSNQPTLPNAQAFQVGNVDSNALLGGVHSGYVRLAQNAQSTVFPGSSLQSTSGTYVPQQTLGYAFQPTVETQVGANRQFTNATFTPPYALQQFPQVGSISQPLPLPQNSIPYGTPFPYLQTFLPPLTGGGLGHLHQCASIPSQQQTPLVAGIEPNLRHFEPIKQFGALSLEPTRRTKPMITSKTNLYISGLNETDTDDTVRSLVENIVQPKSCKAMISNGICKGYGFIDCASEEDAEKAKNHIIEQAKLTGRKLLVKFAHENEKDVHNVYVRHLPLDFTKEKLEALFQKFGQVTSVKLLENEDRLTGIGFVRYALAEQAEKAIEQLNAAKLVLGDNTAPVMCKLADKANTRRRPATAAHATTLVVQPQLSLNNPLHRQGVSISNTVTLPRCAIPFSQPLQPATPFTPSIPLATQLLSPLGQSPVLIQSIQPTGSPQSRGVLSPAVLPNGTPGPNPLLSLPITTVQPGTLNTHVPASSSRATPLIGPPPQTPVSVGLQLNQNAANMVNPYFVSLDSNSSVPKTSTTLPPSRFPGVHPGTNYVQKDGASADQPALNGPQLPSHVGQLPVKLQYSASYVQSQQPQPAWQIGTNGCNSQLVFLTTPSILANFPTAAAAATSLLPTYVCPPLTQPNLFTSPDLAECGNRYLKLSLPSLPSSYESDTGSEDSIAAINKPDGEMSVPSNTHSCSVKCNGDNDSKGVNLTPTELNAETVELEKGMDNPDQEPAYAEKETNESSMMPPVPANNPGCDGLVLIPSHDKVNSLLDTPVSCTTPNCTPSTPIGDVSTVSVTVSNNKMTVDKLCDGVDSSERTRTDSWWSRGTSGNNARKKNQESISTVPRGRRRQSDGASHASDSRSGPQMQARGPNRRKPLSVTSTIRQSSELSPSEDDSASTKQVDLALSNNCSVVHSSNCPNPETP